MTLIQAVDLGITVILELMQSLVIMSQGECENRSGYFPAKFVAKIRPYEVVYVANKAIMTTDMNVKKNQVRP